MLRLRASSYWSALRPEARQTPLSAPSIDPGLEAHGCQGRERSEVGGEGWSRPATGGASRHFLRVSELAGVSHWEPELCPVGVCTRGNQPTLQISTLPTLSVSPHVHGTRQDTLPFSIHTWGLYTYQKSVVCLSKTVGVGCTLSQVCA